MPASAADDYTPRPQRTFSEKPRIEDYADYNAFLVDIMEFRRQKKERLQARGGSAAPSAATLSDDTLASVSGRQDVDLRDLYDIKAPESLEEALERARKLPHPVYAEMERFGRTTSNSFPIPALEGEELVTGEVSGLLQDLEQVNPDTFRNPSDEEQAAHVLEKDPDNTDDAADVKAADGVEGIFKPLLDIASRYATDSEGRQFWVPLRVDGEAGETIIYTLNIRVGVDE